MSKIITRKYIQRITKREGDTNIRRNSGGGGGGGGVSQYWVDDNYVSKEFFNRLFEIHDENGDPILPNDVETEIDNIQAMFGFWTNAYLSALGQNEGGGGAELTLASLADVAVQGVTDGQALVWSASQGKWVPGEGGGGTDMQTVWQELATTGTQQINKTHLTTALSDFVTIDTAQTISGAKTFTSSVYLSAITEPSSERNGMLAYKPSGWGGISSSQWGVGATNCQGVIRSSNTNLLHYKGGTSYTIWDESNDGAGSGLDADLLDGHHAADFALASAITDMATQTWVSTNYLTKTDANNTYLSIAFFRALFRAYTSGGSEVVPNGGSTSTIDNIKAMFGFWTNSYLSALGNNPGGASLTLSSLSDVSISGATAGQVLTYRNGTWRNETPQGGGGSAEELTNKIVTQSTIDGLSGSFTFQGDNLINSATDYVGMQIGSAYDKIQIAGQAGSLMIRQNDNGGTSTSGWTEWTAMLTASNYANYITGYLPLTGGTMTNTDLVTNMNADLLDGRHATDFAYGTNGIADSASALANKTVTTSTIDGLSGSFTFEGNNLINNQYDWVGLQVGSSVDKAQLLFDNGTIRVRQNDSGGTNSSDWTAWTMLPTKVFTKHQITTAGWYRVANLTTYGLSYIISIRENYYNAEPTPATFIINTSYTNATITQIGRATRIPNSITKLRVVKYGNGTYHVDVYAHSASMNTPEVNIFNLGRENTSDGIGLVEWTSATIASGETLIEEAEISTGTMIAGDILLNNAQYIGWNNNAGTAQRMCIGLNSSNDFLVGYTTAGSGYNTYLDGNSVQIRYGTSRSTGIYLNSSGNVGIGTTSPSYKLHVGGTGYYSGNLLVQSIDIGNTNEINATGSAKLWLQYRNSGALVLCHNGANCGVGVDNPAYKLDVNGDVQATNFRGNFVGNADSATKLQTARTIWGQSFDGTANVSGAITGATTISASSNVSVGGTLSVTGTSTMTGHVGIGTSPHSTYVLRANGEVYVSTGLYSHGYVTALSDIRHKDVMGDVKLTVSEVANAPAVKFLWKDRRQEGLQVGSIAQYWKKVLPEAIVEAADGELTMSYGVIALLAAIANAREIVNLKREIAELKRTLSNHGILE